MQVKTINPDSTLKEIWDILIAILTIFIAIEIPLRLAYNYGITNIYVEITISVLLFIDIILNFFTEIYVKGIVIKNRKYIKRYYLRRFFIFDVLAAIPFSLLTLVFPQIRWLRWMNLARLFKLLRIQSLISKWRNHESVNPSVLRLGVFFFWILLIAHWVACMWIFIAIFERLETIPTYLDSIYWCITTLTTVGYGDISPVTDLQKILTMIAMILGVGVYGFVIGNIASLLSNIDVVKTEFLKQMEDINSFLTYKSVPKRLKQKVQNYYQYVWHNRMAHCEYEVLSNLPPSLKNEISLHMHRNLIEQVPFFKNIDKCFLCEIIQLLKQTVFLPGDFIFRKGDVGNCMYFIGTGSVNVLLDDGSTILATLKAGDHFGEIALIKKVARTRSVISNEYCILYALDKDDFDRLLEKFPQFKKHILETIKQRGKGPSDTHIET
jgi:hypothetical protein